MVRAAYAANPVPELPASQFLGTGGTAYLGTGDYPTATGGVTNWLPKVGVVYSLNNKTVIRGGFGMYADTLNASNDRPQRTGFNQATATPISNDNGLTFCCGVGAIDGLATGRTVMNDPFPVRPASGNTRFDDPYKSTLSSFPLYNTDAQLFQWDHKPAMQSRWRIGFQREIVSQLDD